MMVVQDIKDIAEEAGYPVDAFVFVQRGLDFTVKRTHGELEEGEEPEVDPETGHSVRHVSGADLCHGLRDFAVQQYGLLARHVLRRWRITRCEDFGRIVFAMVESGMMQKTDDDDLTDFAGVFDFAQAFSPDLVLAE